MNTYSLIERPITQTKVAVALSRKERDKQLRRDDILKAAARIFALKGYYKATIQDIAQEAEYATGTVYLYFKDKDELYFSLVFDKLNELLSMIRESSRHVNDARKKLEVFLQESLSYFEKNRDFFRIYISERNRLTWMIDTTNIKIAGSHTDQLFAYLLGVVKEAQEQNVIRRDFGAKHIANILAPVFCSVIFDFLSLPAGKVKDLKEKSDFILDVFLNGVGKKK